ncbi:hypothetical protein T06_4029 [Trichinella sp. T6]|nr:hypothetical protein T06_4029 [Trichinella sp. T6]
MGNNSPNPYMHFANLPLMTISSQFYGFQLLEFQNYLGLLGEDSKKGTFSKIYTTGRRNLFCLKLNRLLLIESTYNFQSEVKLYTC